MSKVISRDGIDQVQTESFVAHMGRIKTIYIKHTVIGSRDNDSTRYWPPGSLHTLGAGGHI